MIFIEFTPTRLNRLRDKTNVVIKYMRIIIIFLIKYIDVDLTAREFFSSRFLGVPK